MLKRKWKTYICEFCKKKDIYYYTKARFTKDLGRPNISVGQPILVHLNITQPKRFVILLG